MTLNEIDRTALKVGDRVWACELDIDVDRYNNATVTHLYCEPAYGEIVSTWESHYDKDVPWFHCSFALLNKNGQPRKSGRVSLRARRFARTYEDCVQIYNSIIDEKINYLNEKISELTAMKVS